MKIKPLECPNCKSSGAICEIDSMTVYAIIEGVGENGEIVWGGLTYEDWGSQEPAHNPPIFLCKSCGHEYHLMDQKLVPIQEGEDT